MGLNGAGQARQDRGTCVFLHKNLLTAQVLRSASRPSFFASRPSFFFVFVPIVLLEERARTFQDALSRPRQIV